jgi:hypothetical protein
MTFHQLALVAGSVVLTALSAGPAAPLAAAAERRSAAVAAKRVEDGARLVTVQAAGVPLGEVVAALERQAGLTIRVADAALAERPVSYDVRNATPERALRVLLRGLSYVVQYDGRRVAVTIVAGPTDRSHAGIVAPSDVGTDAGRTRGDAPTIDPDALLREALLRRSHTERLRHGLAALEAGTPEDREAALESLVGLGHPAATHVLEQAVVIGVPGVPGARREAAHQLWRHAAALEFQDAASIAALRRLTGDPDAGVAGVARQALEDARIYAAFTTRPAPPGSEERPEAP